MRLRIDSSGPATEAAAAGSMLTAWAPRSTPRTSVGSEIVLVEGAGGLMSPLGDEEYVADLAADFGFPLVIVARNALGTINQTLQTLIAAAAHGAGPPVAGIVLNNPLPPSPDDPSTGTNRGELAARCSAPILGEVAWGASRFDAELDWFRLAGRRE